MDFQSIVVEFDVRESFDQPQLYIGDKFYAQVDSSVFIDDSDNIYYFKQAEGKNRTLYKNKEKLFSLKGYYSYVSGVDSKGVIYFIANTEYGSGLYRFDNGKLTRAHHANTIFDARLIDDDSALVATMGSDSYDYKRIKLSSIDEAPHEVVLFVESQPYYRTEVPAAQPGELPEIGLENPYNSFLEMNYSGTSISFANDSEAGFVYDITAAFGDPLTQNQASAFISRNLDEYSLAGVSYANNQFFIQFGVIGYGVFGRPDVDPALEKDERDFGVQLEAYLPFWDEGHYNGGLQAHYFQDYESNSRKPISASLDLSRMEHYGASMFPNFVLSVSPYASSDRGDDTFGAEAAYEQGLPNEFFFGLSAQHSSSNADAVDNSRGVKLAKSQSERFKDSDPTTVIMPALKDTAYFKKITKANMSLKKVFNFSSYTFSGPVSLRRESVYVAYNYYDLEPFAAGVKNEQVNEAVVGLALDTVWASVLPIPISFEYIYNDNSTIAENNSFRFHFGFKF